MNLVLVRKLFRADGIFSDLTDEAGGILAVTLEWSYLDAGGYYRPKIPNDTYTCVRGLHRLHPEAPAFETFEVTGVPGHKGILFHKGNWERDTDGCILLGEKIATDRGEAMLLNSAKAFGMFMLLQGGEKTFQLRVVG